jgi:hypothetical protein
MTTEEHRLIIDMFTNQQRLIETLVQVLKSANLLPKGETLDAYEALAFPSEAARTQLERQVHGDYLNAGTILGVKNLPQTSIGD